MKAWKITVWIDTPDDVDRDAVREAMEFIQSEDLGPNVQIQVDEVTTG